ncbi:FAD-binding oxidoreductase [Flindersiella endophytica]
MTAAADWDRLRQDLTGQLFTPTDAAFPALARWPMASGNDQLPAAIARVAGPLDVAAVVRFAEKYDLPTGIRGGGHCFAGHSRTTGVLIDTTGLGTITFDGDQATVGAGTMLSTLYKGLHTRHRTIPAGCGPSVGIAGLTLGGGLGVLGRLHGLTCDALTAAEIVLADGTLLHCDAEHEPDLFWALRGAGSGSFGVVTALRFATVPEPAATAFQQTYAAESATDLLCTWQSWLPDAPPEVSAEVKLTSPADPATAPGLTLIGATIAGAMSPNLGFPIVGARERSGLLHEVKDHLATFGAPDGGPMRSRSLYVTDPLPQQVIQRLVDLTLTERRPGEQREIDLLPLGGAYNRPAPDATAYVHRRDLYLLKLAATPGSQWLTAAGDLLAPHTSGRAYQNFADPGLPRPLTAYYDTNLPRLLETKRRYDPGNRFRHDQSIPLTQRNDQ